MTRIVLCLTKAMLEDLPRSYQRDEEAATLFDLPATQKISGLFVFTLSSTECKLGNVGKRVETIET